MPAARPPFQGVARVSFVLARLARYPAFLGLAQRPEFQEIANDTQFTELRQKGASISEVLNYPKATSVLSASAWVRHDLPALIDRTHSTYWATIVKNWGETAGQFQFGLEASLVSLVDSWRSQNATQPMIQLDMQGDLADVRGTVAATAYRVAQECLTNSLRHSAAREIVLRIERRTGAENALLIRVEDDGGGDAAKVEQSAGFGLTGIRERVAALGGSLSIARARRGVSVAATIPLAA